MLLPVLGEAPLKRLADGTWAADGPALHLRHLHKHFGKMPTAKERLAAWSSVLRPSGRELPGTGVLLGAGPSSSDALRGTSTASTRAPFRTALGRTESIWFGYRDTEFTVPATWYRMYQADLAGQHAGDIRERYGMVSGVNEFLAMAWADFASVFASTGVRDTVWLDMLSCYNLPRETMPDDIGAQFWHSGWGPPYWVYRTINALVMSYAAYINEPCTGDEHCEGLWRFIKDGLSGDEVTNRHGVSCRFSFRFMNTDADNARVGASGETSDAFRCGSKKGDAYACNEGFLVTYWYPGDEVPPGTVVGPAGLFGRLYVDRGYPWDSGLPPSHMGSSSHQWYPAKDAWTTNPGNMPMPAMTSGIIAYVLDRTFTVTRRPSNLAWRGYVVDSILYMARLAYDCAESRISGLSDEERSAYRTRSYELGRYALRILAEAGATLIHELGHVHNGEGGHCGHGQCCFELAAQRWTCALIETMGLPLRAGGSPHSDTWTTRSYRESNGECPDGHDEYEPPEYLCAIGVPGDPTSPWAFWCSACSDGTDGGEVHA